MIEVIQGPTVRHLVGGEQRMKVPGVGEMITAWSLCMLYRTSSPERLDMPEHPGEAYSKPCQRCAALAKVKSS